MTFLGTSAIERFISWWFGEDKITSQEEEPDKAPKRYRRSLRKGGKPPTQRQKIGQLIDMGLEIEVSEPKKFRKVPKWTHAAKDGTEIFCPKCGKTTLVYSFSWALRGCGHCKERVKKYEWLLEV